MSTKISDLTSATSLTGAEEVPIVQTGTTKKTTVGEIPITRLINFGNSSAWTNPSSNSYNPISISKKFQYGDYFSIANNKITCLKDVKFLYFLTVSLAQGSTNANKFFRLRKNGTTEVFTFLQNSNGAVVEMSAGGIFVEAQANDYFEICFYGSNSDSIDTNRLNISFIVLNSMATLEI